jgi:hypothetical protein
MDKTNQRTVKVKPIMKRERAKKTYEKPSKTFFISESAKL